MCMMYVCNVLSDAADVGSYRPISNLSVISKLLERGQTTY